MRSRALRSVSRPVPSSMSTAALTRKGGGERPAPPPIRSFAALFPGGHVDVGHAGSTLAGSRRAGSAEEKLLGVPREGGPRLAEARVDVRAEVYGGGPRVLDARACRRPDIRTAEAASAIRREHDLAAVLSHVRLDVVCSRVVQLDD